MQTQSMVFKVVTLGDGRVGKTSITYKYVYDEFSETQQSTKQANYLEKQLLVEGQNIQLNVWDTAGQEQYRSLQPIYYRNADGAIIVYDITNIDSFNMVKNWLLELRSREGDHVQVVLCGNKCDKQGQRTVEEALVAKFCNENKIQHFKTSAKTGEGLNKVFETLSKSMLALSQKDKRRKTNQRGFTVTKEATEKKDKNSKKCCK